MELPEQVSYNQMRREEMIKYITKKMQEMEAEKIAFVLGLVQGLTHS